MKIIDNIKKYFSERKRKNKQSTWIYCSCGNEMVGDYDGNKNPSFIRDVYVDERNIVHYKCSKCEKESFYDFDFPSPVLLPFTENDNIIEQYRKQF